MLFICFGLTCLVLVFLFFVTYCRSLLAAAARVTLSGRTAIDFEITHNASSGDDFPRLRALAGICQDSDGERNLRLVQIYYRLLEIVHSLFEVTAPRIAMRVENERRACTHFAAVILEKRVGRARELWRRCTLDDHKADSST
jgi:hypothetical protein